MSKLFPSLVLLILGGVFSAVSGQVRIDATITINGTEAQVDGKLSEPQSKLLFLDNYAGVSGLAKRISNVSGREIAGGTLDMLPSADGTAYEGGGKFSRFVYRVSLQPLADRTAAAHVSWVGGDTGILMLDDLLPQTDGIRYGTVKLVLPSGWTSFPAAASEFKFDNADKAAFLIAKNARTFKSDGIALNIVGSWQFSDADASKFAGEVFGQYSRLFGGSPATDARVNIIKFPTEVQPGEWEADTRGSTVTIVSSDTPFGSQSIQRMHEQLRHEVFHLWIPNAVNLSGQYDWFYEGFALYQSLKLGVGVNRIRFEDYLDTLTRAYSIDNFTSRRTSLIEASRTRFQGTNNTAVYARGMLVAFLADIAILDASKGKASSNDVVSEVFASHTMDRPRVDGNEAVLAVMRKRPELALIVSRYITGAEPINIEGLLKGTGLEAVTSGREKIIKVAAKPTEQQKKILDKLGYNNWRKAVPR